MRASTYRTYPTYMYHARGSTVWWSLLCWEFPRTLRNSIVSRQLKLLPLVPATSGFPPVAWKPPSRADTPTSPRIQTTRCVDWPDPRTARFVGGGASGRRVATPERPTEDGSRGHPVTQNLTSKSIAEKYERADSTGFDPAVQVCEKCGPDLERRTAERRRLLRNQRVHLL